MNDGKSMEIEDMFSSEYKKVMNNVEVYGRLIESMERKDQKMMKQNEDY